MIAVFRDVGMLGDGTSTVAQDKKWARVRRAVLKE